MRINWYKVWDVAAWISFFYLIFYFLMKAWGIWNSPISADTVAIFGAGILIGRHLQRFDHLTKDVDILNKKRCPS